MTVITLQIGLQQKMNTEIWRKSQCFELNKLLTRFFIKFTKSTGIPYKPGTVKAFHSSISRYLTYELNISKIKDKEFKHSLEVLSAKIIELKTMGLG